MTNAIDLPDYPLAKIAETRRQLREMFGYPPDCQLVGSAGRLSPEKGVALFLNAAAQVLHSFPSANFLVFGDGPLRGDLEQLSSRLGLGDNVRFAGFVSQLRKLLPGLDLLVNPSHSEEMPNIVLEAMAASVPVVATAVGSVPEMAGPKKAISVVLPGNSGAIAKAVSALLRNPEACRALAKAGRERVEQTCSPAQQKAQLHQLYGEFLAARPLVAVPVNSRRPNELVAGHPTPFISVIIPVRNEGDHLGRVLADLELQEYPQDRFEILVVDGKSTDDTSSVVEQFAKRSSHPIRSVPNPKQLSSAGRNRGMENSRGELIVFVDGHCRILSPTLLSDTARLFQSTGADCLCRAQPLLLPENTWFQDLVARARATRIGHGTDSTIFDANREGWVNPSSSGASYRRSVFLQIGDYDECFDACEDVEFNYRLHRARMLSYISPLLTVFYWPRKNICGLWRQMERYGRGRFRLMRKYPEAFSVAQIIPAGLLVWLVVGMVASVFSRAVSEFYLATLALYVGVVLLFSGQLGVRHGWRHLVAAPAIFLTIHIGLGAGVLAEAWRCLLPRKRKE